MNNDNVKCLTPWDGQSIRIHSVDGAYHTLFASTHKSGLMRDGIVYAIDQQGGKGSANFSKDVMPTILSDSHGTPHGVVYGVEPSNVIVGCDLYNGELTGEKAATIGANSCLSANHAGPSVICFQLCGDRDNPSVSVSKNAYFIPANPMSDMEQAVVYNCRKVEMFENHSQDSRYTGPLKVSQTISQTFGAGGNNCPIIVEITE